MDSQLIFKIVECAILIIAFLVGRYVIPNIPPDTAIAVKSWITTLSVWATKFVHEAAQFTDKTGAEKKDYVIKEIVDIAQKNGFEITTEQASALVQEAYDTMKNA